MTGWGDAPFTGVSDVGLMEDGPEAVSAQAALSVLQRVRDGLLGHCAGNSSDEKGEAA